MNKIRVGIVGYGNLGKGVELSIDENEDIQLVGVFTRRDPASIETKAKVFSIDNIKDFKDEIDVMILCGGSAKDLPKQGPELSVLYNTVDSYDNHSKIPGYFNEMNEAAKNSNKVSIISVGWDPGLFSLNRLLFESILPQGKNYTFWGEGISQGHSDAIRGVKGVKRGVQYTRPIQEALDKVRMGENPELTNTDRHKRICYIVPEKSANLDKIKNDIKTMPDYFEDYDTEVYFISEEEFIENHDKMPHGGFVIHTANTGVGHKQRMEFSLTLESNPEFTSSVLVAYARAVYKLSQEGRAGAYTVFDVPFSYLSPESGEALRKRLL